MKKAALFTIALVGFCTNLSAAQAYLGYLELFGDTASGYQQVKFFNTTGASALGGDCTTAAAGGPSYICDAINITNWSVSVHYLDAGSNPQTDGNSSLTCSGSGCGTIQPYLSQGGDGSILFAIPYVAGTCPPCFTEIVVSGTIPSSFLAYDPDSSTTGLFQAVTPFSVDWLVSSTPGDGPFDATDVLVNSNSNPGGGVPEPGTMAMLLGGLVWIGRRCLAR